MGAFFAFVLIWDLNNDRERCHDKALNYAPTFLPTLKNQQGLSTKEKSNRHAALDCEINKSDARYRHEKSHPYLKFANNYSTGVIIFVPQRR